MTTPTTTSITMKRILLCLLVAGSFLVVNHQAFVLRHQPSRTMVLLPRTRKAVRLSAATASTATRPVAPPTNTPPDNNNDDDKDNHRLRMGRAVDILNKDYADVLRKNPDFSIYDASIQCVGPNGAVKLTGLGNYKAAFSILHALVPLAYTDTAVQHKIVDSTCGGLASASSNNNTIRIHWHMQATPRFSAGLSHSSPHNQNRHTLDGISVYHVSPTSGNITQHTIERLLWQPPAATTQLWQQLFSLQRRQRTAETAGVAVPNCAQEVTAVSSAAPMPNHVLQFQSSHHPFATRGRRSSSLFAGTDGGVEPQPTMAQLDVEAMESRNKSRKKFGLKPLSPQEFVDLQQQITSQEQAQKQLAATVSPPAPAEEQQQESFLDKVRGALGSDKLDTCDSNFDCDRPMVCCDFGLVKRCCSAGAMVGPPLDQQRRLVPVPADSGYEKRPRQFPPSR